MKTVSLVVRSSIDDSVGNNDADNSIDGNHGKVEGNNNNINTRDRMEWSENNA